MRDQFCLLNNRLGGRRRLETAIAHLDEQSDSAHSSLGTAASVAFAARRILAIMRLRTQEAAEK